MSSIQEFLQDPRVAAITVRQDLEPMEGWETPIFPPTYPVPDKRGHRHDTPYTVNELKDGRRVATLDSVQSQANRMEESFVDELAYSIPQLTVHAGERTVALSQLPHRLADAAIRTSDLKGEIREAFEAYAAGDPLPVAKLGPTSLVYGAWDSRDTRVKIPRLIRSEIHAWDVDVFTRSAQFSATFSREDLGFTEKEWARGAEVGFAPTPSVEQHGGVMIHGGIRQNATIHLGACRSLERAQTGLGTYVLGLALAGLWTGGREYALRTGCWLVPTNAAEVTAVRSDGERTATSLDADTVRQFLDDSALSAAQQLGIAAGSSGARVAQYDPKAAKELLKKDVGD